MPVTIKPDGHGAGTTLFTRTTQDTQGLLEQFCPKDSQKCEKIIRSSFTDANLKDSNVYSSANGFVYTAIEAYYKHYHLTIRPEDVWFAILSQLSIWINTNAEEARGKFVTHEGKKDLAVAMHNGDDIGKFAQEMTREIEKNVTDPKLREWIMPAFTTTTATDAIVASILIMGDLPKSVRVIEKCECGLPSITLLGELSDWEGLYKKLDKLETFGTEPAQFGSLLKPIISRFVKSFHDPTSETVVQFWGHMINDESSEPGKCDGWITAFCFWSLQEENLNDKHMQLRGGRGYKLDGMVYHTVDSDEIPPAYATVPVKINDNGNELAAIMLAGSIGKQYTSRDGTSDGSGMSLVSLSPILGWSVFTKKEGVEETAEASKAGPGNPAEDTELTTSIANEGSVALPEDNPSPVAATSAKKPSLMSRLANLFSRTEISK